MLSKSHPQVVTTAKALAPELQAIQQHQALFTELAASPTLALLDEARNAVGNHLLSQIIANKSEINSITPYSTQLQALKAAESNPDFQVLTAHGAEVANAKQSACWGNGRGGTSSVSALPSFHPDRSVPFVAAGVPRVPKRIKKLMMPLYRENWRNFVRPRSRQARNQSRSEVGKHSVNPCLVSGVRNTG